MGVTGALAPGVVVPPACRVAIVGSVAEERGREGEEGGDEGKRFD